MNLRAILVTVVAALLFACGPKPVTPPEPEADAGQPDAGTPDAGLECPLGSHLLNGACTASIGWADGGSFTTRREHHVTFLASVDAGTFLYVAAGVDRTNRIAYTLPQRAKVDEAGLGVWEAAGPDLPLPLFGPSVARVGNDVLVTGGQDTNLYTMSAKTFHSKLQPDGMLSAWADGPVMPYGVNHHCMATHGNSVYLLGGGLGDNGVARVIRSDLTDGAFTPWQDQQTLPKVISHEACAVHHDGLFLIGGISGSPASGESLIEIYRAPIQSDSSLGAWQTVGELPATRSISSAVIYAGNLFLIGGLDPSGYTSSVIHAPLPEAHGPVGAWVEDTPLPLARGHVHQTPVWNQHIYSVGGFNGESITNVLVGKFE